MPLPRKDDLEALMRVEPLAIEVGLGLASLVAGGKTSPLLNALPPSAGSSFPLWLHGAASARHRQPRSQGA